MELETKLFGNSQGMVFIPNVRFQKGIKEIVNVDFEESHLICSYDLNWIEENVRNYSTILNNFIYLFDYVDEQMRWTMVSKISNSSIFERYGFINSKNDYHINFCFNIINYLSNLQMGSYIYELDKLGVRIEEVISCFFKVYLSREFNINDFNINVPSKNSNFLEKCRFILPEIDSCLKQYNYYVDDGKIDSELVQISSSHLFFNDVKSLIPNKYVYSNGPKFNLITHYFFLINVCYHILKKPGKNIVVFSNC